MLDRAILQIRGFKNVSENGRITGFQFDVRNPAYRGFAGSQIDGIDVVVDGERFGDSVPLWTLQGQTVTLDQLRSRADLRWSLDEVATITVPKPGGLAVGVHQVDLCIYLRHAYFPPMVSRAAYRADGKGVIVSDMPDSPLRLGIATYSYTGDLNTLMTLDDVMQDMADIGVSGLELLGEANIPGYPEPSVAWLDTWFAGLDKYRITPTNLCSWVDNRLWQHRELTDEEGATLLIRDLELAHRLGFSTIRPKFSVTSWELDPYPNWQSIVERSLDTATKLNIVICPEIHSPTPIQHPVTQGYIDFIERTKTEHFRLMIDTGIFMTQPSDDGHDGIEEKGKKRPAFMEPLAVPMSDLAEVLPYTQFIQSKFYEIDDDLNDLQIPWPAIVDTLLANNWSGWLSSEYEGRREPYRGKDQVRRQHAMLRKLLAEQTVDQILTR